MPIPHLAKQLHGGFCFFLNDWQQRGTWDGLACEMA